MSTTPTPEELQQILAAIDEIVEAVEQLPLADALLLVQATRNTTGIAEIATEYTRLKEREER